MWRERRMSHLGVSGSESYNGCDHGVHSADIVTPANLVVPMLSPVVAPGVLQDPVRLFPESDGGIRSRPISNKKHSMIQTG